MILIKDGRLVDPKSGRDEVLDIVIQDNRIQYIGKFQRSEQYDQIIEAKGKVIAPGLIDIHVHFREPGLTYKEDIQTGSAAAAKGGYTTVVCMANTKPVVDNPETLQQVLDSAKESPIHVLTVAAVTKGMGGKELTDFAGLLEQGAAGLSDDGIPLLDTKVAVAAMELAKSLDVPISLHEEDPALIGVMGINDGQVAAELEITGAPNVSEASMVARDCMLALHTGAKVNIQHISTAEGVECVRMAKALGASVTAEVTPQHFSLTQDAVRTQGALAKLNPPLRTEEDRYALIRGLKDGVIDIIATDHAPHSAEEKSGPIPKTPSGMIGLETALGLGITNLVRQGHLTLMGLLEKMTVNPANLYGLDAGYLAEGGPADLVIFDEKESWTVSEFASKSSNSPFKGQKLYGAISCTICDGKVVYHSN